MEFLEAKWHRVVPDQPFVYSFLDKSYEDLYRSEHQTSKVIFLFSAFAIVVSSIGLFSLVSLLAHMRTKEIGVRKVLGASIPDILFMIMHEYLFVVAAANIVAWPIAYFAMNHWLQDFAYRTDVGVGTFILAALLAFAIAIATTGYQAIRAATANPADALRYE
jgi:ABC-type antimicrobial peptide transport system permease subunit